MTDYNMKETKVMKRIIVFFLFANIFKTTVSAQEGSYRYFDASQLWRTTKNAAGLSLDSMVNRGWAAFTIEHNSGSYHRVQEGSQKNRLRFQTERYQKIGRFLVGYGQFAFDMDRTKNRAWADVYRPYDANPYYPGSNVVGKYDQQSFDFTGALGSVGLSNWRFGLRLDYKVGDLSRLRDPRSRSELLDYQLTPSATFSLGQHSLGLAPYYHRRKEKMPTLTTVQNDPNLSYYEMRGLEQCIGAIGAYKSFNRQWVDHRLGFQFSYAYHHQNLHSLNTIGFERGEEDILENEKREPAHYGSSTFSLSSLNRIHQATKLHEIDLNISYQQAYGDEYTQQRIQETDPSTGVVSYRHITLITYNKRYQMKQLKGGIRYRMNFIDMQQTTAYIGARFCLQNTYQKRILPTSTFDNKQSDIIIESGKTLLKRKLWIDLSCRYHFAGTKDRDLSLAEPTSIYAQQVLFPDMEYYKADYWRGHLQLTYQFPLRIKGTETHWFIRAYGDYLKTNNSLDGKCAGLTIGLYN